jgi:HPt (histidine-containing phosphotransfer) domain-containing protein
MTPFSATPPSHPELSLGQRLFGRAPVIVFVVLVILGLSAVGWRTSKRGAERKTQARAQAALAGLALERELAQAVTASEALGMAAALPGSSTAGFDGTAIQLMASRPGLSSLEWAPGGAVGAVFPRSGSERSLGRNLFRDPVQAGAANEAFRRRQTLVFGPVPTPRGEAVFVALRPVFVRARDGRENFWGFVSASVRKNDVLSRAQLDQLRLRGYEYHLFIPPYGARKAFTLISNGDVAVDSEVQQRVRAHNLEMILAVQAAGGWYGLSHALLQIVAVVFGAGLVALLVALKEERMDVRSSIDELQTKLARESSDKLQAQEDCKAAKNQITTLQTEVARTSAAVQAAEMALAELRNELHSLAAAEESSRRELQKVLEQRREFQEQLEKQAQATQHELSAVQAQLSQARAELEKQTSQLRELHAQSEQATRDAAKTAEKLDRERAQALASAAEWKARFEEAITTAKTNEEEQSGKLAAAHQQISALTEALAATKRDLEAAASLLETVEPGKAEPSVEPELQPIEEHPPLLESNVESTPEPEAPKPEATDEPTHIPVIPEESTKEASVETAPEVRVAPPQLAPAESAVPAVSSEAKPEPVADEPAAPDSATSAPIAETAEPQPKAPAEKPARKRKGRKDQQIDLFSLGDTTSETPPAPEPAAAETAAAAPEKTVVQAEPASEPVKEPGTQPDVADMPGAEHDRDYTDVFTETTAEPESAKVPSATTAEAAPSVEVNFPAVPGLAVSEGLSLADGDPDKFRKALELFVDHQRKATSKIRDHMVQGDMPAAERVLNSLKVAAGEIGAISLRESATKLDQAMHGESEPAEVEFLWLEVDKNLRELLAGLKPVLEEAEENRAPARTAEPRLKVDAAQLRKAVNQILPLLTDNDPGAKDCFKDYRSVFRPAFASDAFQDFEQAVKKNDFGTGLDLLKKAVKKYGIT